MNTPAPRRQPRLVAIRKRALMREAAVGAWDLFAARAAKRT